MTLLRTFCDTVVESTQLFAVACWGSGCTNRDRSRTGTLVRRSSSVLGCPPKSVMVVDERRMLAKHEQPTTPSA